MTYLVEHPNPHGRHYYPQRRGRVLAIVVHISAGLEDQDMVGPDHSAEGLARYASTTTRRVSWHSQSDSDSASALLPAEATAFHVRGYNSHTYGHEISKRDPDWRDAPAAWVHATITQAAAWLAPVAAAHGVPHRLASRFELDRAKARGGPPVGFIGHHRLDIARRSDPGWVQPGLDTYPWPLFFDAMAAGTVPPAATQEAPAMRIIFAAGRATVLIYGDGTWQHLQDNDEVNAHRAAGVPVREVTQAEFDLLDVTRPGRPQP